MQEVEAGYSAPGLTALTDTENWGGTFTMPVADRFSVGAKVDSLVQDQGLETDIQRGEPRLPGHGPLGSQCRLPRATTASTTRPSWA